MDKKKKPKLFYSELGKGPSLLLLHGLAVTGEMFFPITDKLSKSNRLIIPDLKGHGKSEDLHGPYTSRSMAESVLHLLEGLNLTSSNVLGFSEGGSIALQFAYNYPHRVNKLILIATYSHGLGALGDMVRPFLSPLMLRLVNVDSIADAALTRAGGPPVPAEVVQRFKGMMPHSKHKLVELFRGMARFDSRPWLRQIKAKTLIIAGSDDKVAPHEAHAQKLADGIKDSKLEVIEGAGHTLVFTHGDKLADLVEKFLQED